MASSDTSSARESRIQRGWVPFAFTALLLGAALAHGTESGAQAIAPPPAPGRPTGLADSAALRATVFGTPPQDMAPLPEQSPARRDQYRAALGAAGAGCVLVRPQAARLVLRAGQTRAAWPS